MIKRILPLIPVAVFPFTIWLALGMMGGTEPPPVNPLLLIALFWLLGLLGAVITFVQAVRGKWQGRRGTHAELVERPGIYKEIYDIQMSSDDRKLIEEGGGA